ncbi:MAG: hypothetical protein AB7Q15_07450 [Vicinamibacterales bacterium]
MRNRCTSSGLALRFADLLVPFGCFFPFGAGFFEIDTTLATDPPAFGCSA